jgi:hypothetical protein
LTCEARQAAHSVPPAAGAVTELTAIGVAEEEHGPVAILAQQLQELDQRRHLGLRPQCTRERSGL